MDAQTLYNTAISRGVEELNSNEINKTVEAPSSISLGTSKDMEDKTKQPLGANSGALRKERSTGQDTKTQHTWLGRLL